MRLIKGLTLSFALCTALTPAAFAQDSDAKAKNVILMITDGAGMETWRAASFYRHGALGHEVYDDFDVKVFSSTYPLNTSNEPTRSDEGRVEFDPEMLWGDQPVDTVYEGRLGNYPGYFDGYDYSRADYTDSAAAAGTALATGRKTYNNAINWSNDDEPMKHIGEYVVESGRALGVVTSVQWTHATPAAFLGHNASRNEYAALGAEIVDAGLATVIMGAGHPAFDNDGMAVEPEDEKAFRFVGGQEVWNRLKNGETDYLLIETADDFQALANGELDLGDKTKVLGTAEAGSTLQFSRDGVAMGELVQNVPDLSTMTTGALELLSRDEDGFFLMVESGAVDWAAHANNLPRLIEEQISFNLAVETAVEWIEEHSSFEDTLLIVTTDHGNGLLQGPNADTRAYDPIVNQGQGALPLVRWNSDTHTRELVPLFAKGHGAERFSEIAQPVAGLAAYQVPELERVYVDNTDVFKVAAEAMGIETGAEGGEQQAKASN